MFSQTVEYALRAMVYLASHPDENSAAQLIAARVRVPERYMSKVMRSLVVARLVKSQRGPTGGFVLARPASQISMLAVIEAVDPLPRIEKCPLDNPRHTELCPMHRRLADAIEVIRRSLDRSTLAEVSSEIGGAGRCSLLTKSLEQSAPVGITVHGSVGYRPGEQGGGVDRGYGHAPAVD